MTNLAPAHCAGAIVFCADYRVMSGTRRGKSERAGPHNARRALGTKQIAAKLA